MLSLTRVALPWYLFTGIEEERPVCLHPAFLYVCLLSLSFLPSRPSVPSQVPKPNPCKTTKAPDWHHQRRAEEEGHRENRQRKLTLRVRDLMLRCGQSVSLPLCSRHHTGQGRARRSEPRMEHTRDLANVERFPASDKAAKVDNSLRKGEEKKEG